MRVCDQPPKLIMYVSNSKLFDSLKHQENLQVNGGELSPLVKRNKQTDLASLITMVTQLKRRSREAKQRVSQIRWDFQIKTLSSDHASGTTKSNYSRYDLSCDKAALNMNSWKTCTILSEKLRLIKRTHEQKSQIGTYQSPRDLNAESKIIRCNKTIRYNEIIRYKEPNMFQETQHDRRVHYSPN